MKNYTLRKKGQSHVAIFTVEIEAIDNKGNHISTRRQYDKRMFEKDISYGIQDLLLRASEEGKLEYYQNEWYLDIPSAYDDRAHTLTSVSVVYTDENGVKWDVDMVPARYSENDDEWEEQAYDDIEKIKKMLSMTQITPEKKEELEAEIKSIEKKIEEWNEM